MGLSSPPPLTGQVKDVPFPNLLHFLKTAHKTGLLTLRDSHVEKTIFFKEGTIAFASSNDPNDRLAELALRTGRINFKQYEIAESAFKETRRKKGAILVEHGMLKPRELFDLLVTQVWEMLLGLFSVVDARYAFRETTTLPSHVLIGIALDPDEIIKAGFYRVSNWPQLIERLSPLDNILKQNPDFVETDLVYAPHEQEILNLIDQVRSIRDILALASTRALLWHKP